MEASGGGAMREAEPGLQGGVCSGRWNVRRGHTRRGDVGRGAPCWELMPQREGSRTRKGRCRCEEGVEVVPGWSQSRERT